MKAKISKILISICLIFTFCFFFTGCGDDDNQGVLQLNTKYYGEFEDARAYYYVFTSNTKGYTYSRPKNGTLETISNFVWEYVADDAISCIFTDNDDLGFFIVYIATVGKNVIFFENGSTFIAENYLIKNNIPYVK